VLTACVAVKVVFIRLSVLNYLMTAFNEASESKFSMKFYFFLHTFIPCSVIKSNAYTLGRRLTTDFCSD
jgi:hypothetical protein